MKERPVPAKRGLVAALAVLLLVCAVGVSLRYDLALYAWRQGLRHLAAGTYRDALAAADRHHSRAPFAAPIAYNEGLALYRLGQWDRAAGRFQAAAAEKGLRASASYNLGNALFRLAEKRSAGDPAAARRLFEAAASSYQTALQGDPGAADARANLALARGRAAQLSGAAAQPAQPRQPAGADRQQDGRSGQGKPKGKGERTAGKEPGQRSATPPREAEAAPRPAQSRPELSREEAERILSEARRREVRLHGPLKGGGELHSTRPEKDW